MGMQLFVNDKEAQRNWLVNLPSEIIYMIFDYIPLRTLFYVLRRVCKRFYELLSQDGYFMVRFKHKYLKHFSEFPIHKAYNIRSYPTRSLNNITWTDISVRMDVREGLWGREAPYFHKSFGSPHTTTVDTLKIMNKGKLCVTGGRDRLICLWNVLNIHEQETPIPIAVQVKAHEGWIWNIAEYGEDSFITCGWDKNIKYWSLSRLMELNSFSTERPAMCLSTAHGTLAAGLHNGKTVLIDPRTSNSPEYCTRQLHRGTITGIAFNNEHILTIGEDRRMSVFDVRCHKVLINRHVNCFHQTCPRSLSVYRDVCYIGDSRGYLNAFKMGEDYRLLVCVKVGLERGINAIIPGIEGLVLATSDVGLRFVIPCIPVKILRQINCLGEIPTVDMWHNTIIAGCSNSIKCLHYFKGITEYTYN